MSNTSAVVIAIAAGTLLQVLPAQTLGAPGSQPQTQTQTKTGQANGAKPSNAPKQLLQGNVSKHKRRRHQSATTAVHSAWLTEIIDLDRATAIKQYEEIIKRSNKKQPEMWIAVSRLQELGRLGFSRPEPLTTPGQPPTEVRKALELLAKPFPYGKVLQAPDANTELPPVRPATPKVQNWVRSQIGKERFQSTQGLPAVRVIRPQWLRYYARDVMKRELEGDRTKASLLRRFYFVNFKPMTVSGSREQLYATAMKNLARVIEDESWPPARNDLRNFEKHLTTLVQSESEPAEGAHQAIELIRRLPYYSEKLLASPGATITKPK
ncbi:MAG: hypothetical protein ACI89X_002133 [Planctomycetota bacterium]|jgi:hypothetical protein